MLLFCFQIIYAHKKSFDSNEFATIKSNLCALSENSVKVCFFWSFYIVNNLLKNECFQKTGLTIRMVTFHIFSLQSFFNFLLLLFNGTICFILKHFSKNVFLIFRYLEQKCFMPLIYCYCTHFDCAYYCNDWLF